MREITLPSVVLTAPTPLSILYALTLVELPLQPVMMTKPLAPIALEVILCQEQKVFVRITFRVLFPPAIQSLVIHVKGCLNI